MQLSTVTSILMYNSFKAMEEAKAKAAHTLGNKTVMNFHNVCDLSRSTNVQCDYCHPLQASLHFT